MSRSLAISRFLGIIGTMPDPELTPEEIVSRLVFTDDLTGLYNRRYMYLYLSEEVDWDPDQAEPLSLVMLDLDSFKAVNDTYGHLEGDKTLKQVADILKKSFRDKDIVVRYSGDEFSVVMPGTGREEAMKLAEKARQNLEQEEFEHGKEKAKGTISLSAGVATFPEDARTGDTLLEKADGVLYLSKIKGRNTVSNAIELEAGEAPVDELLPHKLYRGNQEQIEGIVHLADGISEGDNRFVFVKAPSGAGKIRFLGELVRQMESGGTRCIVETCSEHEKTVPYRPLTELIDRLLRQDVKQIERIKDTLSFDELAVTSKEIPMLARTVKDISETEKLTFLAQQFKLFDGLTHTLSALSQERTLCVILDEFQFIDEGTLNIVLMSIKGSSGRVIFVGTCRPDSEGKIEDSEVKKFLDDVRKNDKAFEITLGPLGPENVSELISQILPCREPSEEFDRLMWELSKGDPLYIESLVQILVSKGVIQPEDGKWKIDPDKEVDIPASLDEMVRAQMAMLDEEAEKVLSEAAVIGTNFSLEVLGRVTDTNEGEVLDFLDKAKQLGLVESTGHLNDDELKFVSPEVHDATYEGTDEEFRISAHGRVAEVLVDIYKDHLDQVALTLAHHYRQAGDEERANEFLAMGEERADRIFDKEQIEKHVGGKTVRAKIDEHTEDLSDEQIDLIMQALQALSRTSKSLQMYPEGSQFITQAAGFLEKSIEGVLEELEGFTIGESRDGMLVNGTALDLKKGGMTASEVSMAMHDRSIQSFTIIRGAGRNELIAFAKLLGMPPLKGTPDKNFWDNKLEEAGITRVGVVQRTYVLDAQKARKTGVYKKQIHEPLTGETLVHACALVRHMSGTVEKMALYPPGSSIIATSIKQLEKAAGDLFTECHGFSVSEIDGRLLINGVPPGEKALIGGAADFASVLQRSGIKNCLLTKNVSPDEMKEFLLLLKDTSEPRPVDEWITALEEKGVTHIKVSEMLFAGAEASTKPKQKKEEKKAAPPPPSTPVEKAKEICTYKPDKLLTSDVISSIPEIMEALIEAEESDLLETLLTKITSLVSGEDAKFRQRASKTLTDIYEKSSVVAQEVLLLLSLDSVISCMEMGDSPETYATLVGFCCRIVGRCTEMKDFENLNRAVRAIAKPVMTDGTDSETKKTATEILASLFDSSDIHTLLVQITDADLEVKEQLLNILGGFGPLAVPALVEFIKEENDDTRRLAVQALREGGPESVVNFCKELTRYAPPEPTCRILEILPETGVDIAKAVSQTVLHPDEKVRGMSLELLKGLKHKTVVDMLLGAVGGSDAEAACLAVGALAQLAYAESVEGLCNLLKEPSNPNIQKVICGALGKMGLAEAVPALRRVIEAKQFLGLRSAFPEEVRAEAASALESLEK